MDAITNAFFADPLYYIGFCFAAVAAIAFLTFLRGLLSGSPHLFTIAAHDEHQDHHRYHVIRGLTGLFGLILAWETVRVIAALLGQGVAPIGAIVGLWMGYIVFGLAMWGWDALKDKVVGSRSH